MNKLASFLASAVRGTLLTDEAGTLTLAEVVSSKDADQVVLVAKSEEFFFVAQELLRSEGFGCDERPQQDQLYVCHLFLCQSPYMVRLVWAGKLPHQAAKVKGDCAYDPTEQFSV